MDDMPGMTYFTPDDLEWDELLEDELEIEDHFEAKFVVSGKQLNLIIDANGDGIWDFFYRDFIGVGYLLIQKSNGTFKQIQLNSDTRTGSC